MTMKTWRYGMVSLLLTAGFAVFAASPMAYFDKQGDPEIQSLGNLAFGPEGVLFAADSQSAAIFALEIKDTYEDPGGERFRVDKIDETIAAKLGTTAKNVRIHDLAVHPKSRRAYLSVTRGTGDKEMPVLLRINRKGDCEEVPIKGISYSKFALTDAVDADAKSRRGTPLRPQAITDLGYFDGELYVAGLSNEEFSSKLRRVKFPFSQDAASTSLEIYHGAHGQYETDAPIRTFLSYKIKDEPHLLAAFTCTPLVTFPLSELQPGKHAKGTTVAELGAGNRPLDMVMFSREGQDYLVIANSNRLMMVLKANQIGGQKGITEPVKAWGTEGVPYTSIPAQGVMQLAQLDDENMIGVQRATEDGSLNLRSISKKALLGIFD